MRQLEIHVVKDVKISELACSPNVIVLAKESTIIDTNTNEVSTKIRYIEVCNVEKTEALSIVKNLLKYCLAEFYVCNELNKSFADTNIKQRKLFNQFLSGNIIYRTDSQGKISHALISEIPLSQTALNVKDYHTIANCKKENLKAALHKHAKAILAQCQYLRLIIDKANSLSDEQSDTTDKPLQSKPQATGATTIPTAAKKVAAPVPAV